VQYKQCSLNSILQSYKISVMKHLVYALTFILLTTTAFADAINITQLRHDADLGNARAQVDLAHAYHDGAGGLKQDDAAAVEWFKKAAAQGDLEGEYNLGIAYYRGIGVTKDINEAVKWFHKSAEQGDAEAQYIVAAAYQNGVGGMPKDLVQSDYWLSLAETQGNRDAGRERILIESSMTEAQVAQAKKLVDEHSKPLPKP